MIFPIVPEIPPLDEIPEAARNNTACAYAMFMGIQYEQLLEDYTQILHRIMNMVERLDTPRKGPGEWP